MNKIIKLSISMQILGNALHICSVTHKFSPQSAVHISDVIIQALFAIYITAYFITLHTNAQWEIFVFEHMRAGMKEKKKMEKFI